MPFFAPRIDRQVRRLHIVFGDQLDTESPLLLELDPEQDGILMMEAADESRHVATHFQRTVFFLAAMRHFCESLEVPCHYVTLDDPDNTGSFEGEISRALRHLRPEEVFAVRPGSWRVLRMLGRHGVTVLEDPHFITQPADFASWASGRKTLTMEYWYRELRRREGILVDEGGRPEGGRWNWDKENRNAFRSAPEPPPPWSPGTDEIAREVFELVTKCLPDLPGARGMPNGPLTRQSALDQLEGFIRLLLPEFGRWQDAMWTGHTRLWHSHLSPALNVKLLHPREVIDAAVAAYRAGDAPLNSVEGFVRQILGWREFIRGVYWTQPEAYRDENALGAKSELPDAYWNADTDMACVAEAVRPVLEIGYSHHIQRLMVTGNLGLTLGVDPSALRDWYLGMFVDGVDWVTTPNVIGMSLYADGGLVATKPYAAGGAYINRMSNYCGSCRFDPGKRTGDSACPLTTLYWDFLLRNRDTLSGNHRMTLALKNLERIAPKEREMIRSRAQEVRDMLSDRVNRPAPDTR